MHALLARVSYLPTGPSPSAAPHRSALGIGVLGGLQISPSPSRRGCRLAHWAFWGCGLLSR
eukprot:2621567-Alexandrium_andersonii.AAC.1